MSRKNNIRQFELITAGNMAGNLTSAATNIEFLDNIAIQLNFTGTPTGTFQVQVSVDYAQDAQGNITNAGHWVPVLLPQTPTAAGAAGQIIIDLNQLASPWVRVFYSFTSGTGSLDAWISAKML